MDRWGTLMDLGVCSWHVYNVENKERVLRDEREHAIKEERLDQKRRQSEREARLDFLKKRARIQYDQEESREEEESIRPGPVSRREQQPMAHVELFPMNEQGTEESQKRKQTKSEKAKEQRLALEASFQPRLGAISTEPWYARVPAKESAPHRWGLDDPFTVMRKHAPRAGDGGRREPGASQGPRPKGALIEKGLHTGPAYANHEHTDHGHADHEHTDPGHMDSKQAYRLKRLERERKEKERVRLLLRHHQ